MPDEYRYDPNPDAMLVRGDSNQDGSVSLADAVYTLNALFLPGALQIECDDAADANDDGELTLSDSVYELNALFFPGGLPIPPPALLAGQSYQDVCDLDSTDDSLGCLNALACP